MRKVVRKTVETAIYSCDLCGEYIVGVTADHCWLCGRDTCWQCRDLLFFAPHGSGDLVEMGVSICEQCQEGNEEIIRGIQGELDGVNERLRKWLDTWKGRICDRPA